MTYSTHPQDSRTIWSSVWASLRAATASLCRRLMPSPEECRLAQSIDMLRTRIANEGVRSPAGGLGPRVMRINPFALRYRRAGRPERELASEPIDVDDRPGRTPRGASWGRLWPMPPVMVRCSYLPENFPAYAAGSGCGAPLASPSQGDRGHGDDRSLGESALQVVVARLAVGQAQPPAVVVDHDRRRGRGCRTTRRCARRWRRRSPTSATRAAR